MYKISRPIKTKNCGVGRNVVKRVPKIIASPLPVITSHHENAIDNDNHDIIIENNDNDIGDSNNDADNNYNDTGDNNKILMLKMMLIMMLITVLVIIWYDIFSSKINIRNVNCARGTMNIIQIGREDIEPTNFKGGIHTICRMSSAFPFLSFKRGK